MMKDASRNMWIEVVLGTEGVELSPACLSPANLFASGLTNDIWICV